MKSCVVLFGASGHAKVVIDCIEKMGHFTILGLLDDVRHGSLCGYPILGPMSQLPELVKQTPSLQGVVAIGDNHIRSRIVENITTHLTHFPFATICHPAASIARGVEIGQGSVIMAHTTLNTDVKIGSHTIINTNASLDHDSILENFASLAPNVATGGNVRIGKFTALGIGATVSHGISIGEHCVIGAGACVLSATENFGVYYGCPAKRIRAREIGEKYL